MMALDPENAAKYAGMNEKRNIMLSMAIAGGLAALGASLYYLNGGAGKALPQRKQLYLSGSGGHLPRLQSKRRISCLEQD